MFGVLDIIQECLMGVLTERWLRVTQVRRDEKQERQHFLLQMSLQVLNQQQHQLGGMQHNRLFTRRRRRRRRIISNINIVIVIERVIVLHLHLH